MKRCNITFIYKSPPKSVNTLNGKGNLLYIPISFMKLALFVPK